jgi:hypothetical protein
MKIVEFAIDTVTDKVEVASDVSSLFGEFGTLGHGDGGGVVNAKDAWWESNRIFVEVILRCSEVSHVIEYGSNYSSIHTGSTGGHIFSFGG